MKSDLNQWIMLFGNAMEYSKWCFVGSLIFYMENKMVNSENKLDYWDTCECAKFVELSNLGIESGDSIATTIIAYANLNYGNGEGKFYSLDDINSGIDSTNVLNKLLQLFWEMDYKDKLEVIYYVFSNIKDSKMEKGFPYELFEDLYISKELLAV